MRLREHSCTGCHQTRAIAGFHFTGADRAGRIAANAVAVPASPQFFGDQPRRRAVLEAFAQRRELDFTRGFSARPDARWSQALARTQLVGGWGAACYRPPDGGDADPAFSSWGCNPGLRCVVTFQTARQPGIGACFSDGPARVGEPMQSGRVTTAAYGADRYIRDAQFRPPPWEQRSDLVTSRQEYNPVDKTGGFPGGMLRLSSCERLPGEATCGRVASTGWNDCLVQHRDFYYCLRERTSVAGMRACDARHPCRDDYICTQQFELPGSVPGKGTCIPPYFMFQFRADGTRGFSRRLTGAPELVGNCGSASRPWNPLHDRRRGASEMDAKFPVICVEIPVPNSLLIQQQPNEIPGSSGRASCVPTNAPILATSRRLPAAGSPSP